MYDIFFISENQTHKNFSSLKERFPLAKTAKTYEEAKRRSFTKFFWIVWPDLIIDPSFNFDYQVSEWDTEYVHVFKNGEYYDGVCLCSKKNKVSEREINYRFFISKKEIDVQASIPMPFDIIFISYNESQADQNYETLKERFPRAKRVHGVKGIHNAHIEAAKLSDTEMFWVVDADAIIENSFNFEFEYIPFYNVQARTILKEIVHVWRSKNPITGLEYGYGGVKLLPTKLTLEMDTTTTDMTTSISKHFKVMEDISNITAFNTDAYSTWRSAFRECVKLAINNDAESLSRLEIWCQLNDSVPYGFYAYSGALAGQAYGRKNASNKEALSKINDFTWLQDQWSLEKFQQ